MDFFGLGFGEILLIVIVGLIIFGPDKLPGIARQVGKTVNSIKQQTTEITGQLKKELEAAEAEAGVKGALRDAEAGVKGLLTGSGQDHAPTPTAGAGPHSSILPGTGTANAAVIAAAPPPPAPEHLTSGED